MPKTSILKALYENHIEAENWMSTVPHEISDAFFDTPYIDGLYKNNNILMAELFGDHKDAAEWLLYEWKEGLSCGVDGVMVSINSPEEYYAYLIEHEGWTE